MSTAQNLKKIPYGVSDFKEFRASNYYLVDKTLFIREIEDKGRYVFLIRPRRFGKSLFLTMMQTYYDILETDQFDLFFQGTDIHQNPTAEKNKYMVLKFNFSKIYPDTAGLEESFCGYIKETAGNFIKYYEKYLDIDVNQVIANIETKKNATDALRALLAQCVRKQTRLYVFIDEYDNFANTILSSSGKQAYLDITRGQGFLRSFFNVLKADTSDTDAPISRLFMTGVSPITLDDVTSGFNIATNISLDDDINEIVGFTTSEVETMCEYYRQTGKIHHSTTELTTIMGQWYNHYRFSLDSESEVFSTLHVLYFLREYLKKSRVPAQLIDNNARIDYNKLRQLVIIDKEGEQQANGNFSKLRHIIETGVVHSNIKTGFPIEELKLSSNFISLLYFFGLLTIKGLDDENTPILVIPNESIRQLYYDYISQTIKETSDFSINLDTFQELIKGMAYRGKWQEPIKYIADRMKETLNLRDLISSEKAHQAFWNVYLGLNTLYIVHSERELNQGYADLVLEPSLANNPGIKFSYIIEIKYIKPADYEKENRENLILTLRQEAESQLNQYALDNKFNKTIGLTTLKKLILNFSSHLLVYHSEV